MHTEGPWMFHGPRDNIHVCEERDPNMRVCFMTSTGPTVERARLIAAAPDLLEAVKTTQCPRPCNGAPDQLMVRECIGRGECGCDLGAALRKATAPRP